MRKKDITRIDMDVNVPIEMELEGLGDTSKLKVKTYFHKKILEQKFHEKITKVFSQALRESLSEIKEEKK